MVQYTEDKITENMMKYTHIIWDFNGTILDDVSIGIEAVNAMLSSRRMKTIESTEEYREIFGFPIKDYYRRCGFDFESEDYETVLAPEWVSEYKKREENAGLCDGVISTLSYFRSIGVKQSCISASRSDMLNEQMERLGILEYFDNVIGCDNIFAYGKTHLCVDFVSLHPEDSFVMIGDSTHDAEVASASGIDCVLVTSGHMSKSTLEKSGCKVYENVRSFALDCKSNGIDGE